MTDISPRARYFLQNYEGTMLDPEGPEKISSSGIESYIYPVLKPRRTMVRLAARLWEAGMLAFVSNTRGYVSPFTVVKAVVERETAAVAPPGKAGKGKGAPHQRTRDGVFARRGVCQGSDPLRFLQNRIC